MVKYDLDIQTPIYTMREIEIEEILVINVID